MNQWAVEIQYQTTSSIIYYVEAETPGSALDKAIERSRHSDIGNPEVLHEPTWYYDSDNFPKYPTFKVRPKENLDIEWQAGQDGQDAKLNYIEDWLRRRVNAV